MIYRARDEYPRACCVIYSDDLVKLCALWVNTRKTDVILCGRSLPKDSREVV